MILEIYGNTVDERAVSTAVEILHEGGVIIYPTDTVYGIGCDITNRNALERLYRLKGMKKQKPLSFICADLREVARYALVSNAAYREMRRHLPGPYTFILPATHEVPKMLISKQRTVGIRIPDHELCLEIVRRFGKPIISTSLNSSERTFASDPMEFIDFYDSKVDLIILAGPSYRDVSSVIDFTGEHPLVLREGQGDVSWCFA